MTTESNKPLSLDDLLSANQAQLDTIFNRNSMTSTERLDLDQRPVGKSKPQPESNPPVAAQPATAIPAAKRPLAKKQSGSLRLVAPSTETSQFQPKAKPLLNQLNAATQNILETALHATCQEMLTALLSASSEMGSSLRQQYIAYPQVTDSKGGLIIGQTDGLVSAVLQKHSTWHPGDVVLLSDPYLGTGALGRVNDWAVVMPVFVADELVGFCALSCPVADAGGAVAQGIASNANSVFAESLCIPPLKLFVRGELNQAVLDLVMANTRTAELNHACLTNLIDSCQIGVTRVNELCQRFSKHIYQQACNALRERSRRLLLDLILSRLPEEPMSFTDALDDDGCGNGPFTLKLTVWREGERAFFDWTGTSSQTIGPINLALHKESCRLLLAWYFCKAAGVNPQWVMNNGFYDLFDVTLPAGSLLNPEFPAPLDGHGHTLMRVFDLFSGVFGKVAAELSLGASYGSQPQLRYSGVDRAGQPFSFADIVAGGLAGHVGGDGLDGHSWWPLCQSAATEKLEMHYPLLVEQHKLVSDSGGAGQYRGGHAVEKSYRFLADGELAINDERQQHAPWGIAGGQPGGRSQKWLVKHDGQRQALAAKQDKISITAGDRLIFRTAAGGGWGDPLLRDAETVRNDVAHGLVSGNVAYDMYGVVINNNELDKTATQELRRNLKRNRGGLAAFQFANESNSE